MKREVGARPQVEPDGVCTLVRLQYIHDDYQLNFSLFL